MPSNLKELRAEILYQFSGCSGMAEDIISGHNNKVGKLVIVLVIDMIDI